MQVVRALPIHKTARHLGPITGARPTSAGAAQARCLQTSQLFRNSGILVRLSQRKNPCKSSQCPRSSADRARAGRGRLAMAQAAPVGHLDDRPDQERLCPRVHTGGGQPGPGRRRRGTGRLRVPHPRSRDGHGAGDPVLRRERLELHGSDVQPARRPRPTFWRGSRASSLTDHGWRLGPRSTCNCPKGTSMQGVPLGRHSIYLSFCLTLAGASREGNQSPRARAAL